MPDNLQHLSQYAILADDCDNLERRLRAFLLLIWKIQGKRYAIIDLDNPTK